MAIKDKTLFGITKNSVTKNNIYVRFFLLIIFVILVVVFIISVKNCTEKNKTVKPEPLIGQNIEKILLCYRDEDCPDQTYCNDNGMCISSDMLPILEKRILGRGRGGEGQWTRLSSQNTRGQK